MFSCKSSVQDDLCTVDDSELRVLASPISSAPAGVDEDKMGNLDGFSEFFAMDEEEEPEVKFALWCPFFGGQRAQTENSLDFSDPQFTFQIQN